MFPSHDRGLSYRVRVSLPEGMCPFSLARKAGAWRPNKAVNLRKYIKSVEYVGEKEAQCIMVDNLDHLYVTDDLIVTHNTLVAVAAGLEQVLGKNSSYNHLIVSRPIQPLGKDLGGFPVTIISPLETLGYPLSAQSRVTSSLPKCLAKTPSPFPTVESA